MRIPGLFMVLAVGLFQLPIAVHAATNYSITDLIPLIPPCAISCVITGFASNPKALSDPESTCRNTSLQAPVAHCIQGACNYSEQAKVGILNSKVCDGIPPDKSRVWALLIVKFTLGPLAFITIGMRTYSRYAITKKMGADDWTMLAAGMVLVGVLACSFENVLRNGFGLHYWNLDVTRVTPLLTIFYVAEALYVLEITLVKVSILLFYLRVFPTRWFRIVTICLIVGVFLAGIGVLMPVFFQCSPIRGAWDRSVPAKCININLLAYATGGIGVGFDLIILVLPIPELLKLKMSRKKKKNVLFMFSLGGIACVTSMVRLKYLADFTYSTDQTWDNAIAVIVSLLEICIAIICACLPALRALISHYLPQWFSNDSTVNSNSNPNPRSESSKIEEGKNTKGSQTLFSPTGASFHSKKDSQGFPSPRTLQSVNEKSIGSDGSSTLNNGSGAWGGKGAYIAHDREVAQDFEKDKGEMSHYNSVSPTDATKATIVTTKIWTGHLPGRTNQQSQENHHRLHPLGSQSIDRGRGAPFRPTNSSDESFHQLTGISRTTAVTRSYEDSTNFEDQSERTDSDDSVFVLEGPRESDMEDDDERRILASRGRSQVAQRSEQVPTSPSTQADIEMQRFRGRSGSPGRGSFSTSLRSDSESRSVRMGLSVPSQGRTLTPNHSLSQTRNISGDRSRGPSSGTEERRNFRDDMDAFGRGGGSNDERVGGREEVEEHSRPSTARRTLQIPTSMFNRNPPTS